MFGMRFHALKPITERIRLIQHVRTVIVDIAHSGIGREHDRLGILQRAIVFENDIINSRIRNRPIG
jgi:hypothetical protein